MRWKTILKNSTLQSNIFNFSLAYTKKKEDGSSVSYSFTVNIPDIFVRMRCGERRVSEYVEELYMNAQEAGDMSIFYAALIVLIGSIKDNFIYKWGALMDANQLYFNPLWNVDGSETVTEDIAKREKNTTNDYGNNTPYTLSVQYGKDTNTAKYGNNASYTETLQYGEATDTHKTNPFNDSNSEYTTSKDTSATHTDTATYNPHTDVSERDQHTDTTTYNPHTDKEKVVDDAHKDYITTERHGNIGVTKSTELLKDYMELPAEMFAPILDDLMSYLSEGY